MNATINRLHDELDSQAETNANLRRQYSVTDVTEFSVK